METDDGTPSARFLTLKQAAEELNTSVGVLRSLTRSGTLPAIQIGGRGQWRIERVVLEEFIRGAYEDSRSRSDEESREQ